MSDDDNLRGALLELEKRAAARGETLAQQRARYRGYLQAAFGADLDLALSGGEGGPD